MVLGLPVAIGKPNTLVNAFVARALADRNLKLTIITALSLRAPKGSSDLERRLIEPFSRRVFGTSPELEYLRLIERQQRESDRLIQWQQAQHGSTDNPSIAPGKLTPGAEPTRASRDERDPHRRH